MDWVNPRHKKKQGTLQLNPSNLCQRRFSTIAKAIFKGNETVKE